jgi:hypothetical protein
MQIMDGSRLFILSHLLCRLLLLFHQSTTNASFRYQDHRFEKWGNLRVINEDRVAPDEGYVHFHTILVSRLISLLASVHMAIESSKFSAILLMEN